MQKCIFLILYGILISEKNYFFFYSAELSNLTPNTRYRIYVYAENGVSEISNKKIFAEKEVLTQASIPQVSKPKALDVGETHISLSWELQDESKGQVVVLQYEVLHYIKGQMGTEAVNYTKTTNITFRQLKKKTEYVFQVISLFGEETLDNWNSEGIIIQSFPLKPML